MTTMNSARILIVGDVMLDRYWFGEVNRISPEAPVPVVRVERREERLGGAANVARNAATLGAQTGLLGVIGQDEAGAVVEGLLTDLGISSYLNRDPAISTIIKLRVIGRQQQLVRVDFEDAPTDTVLRDKLTQFNALIDNYDVIVLSDYAKGSLVNVADMISVGKKLGKRLLVDPKGDDFARYKGASILTPNRSELIRITGNWKSEEELTTKAQNLRRSLDLEALLLTRSEEGMTLYQENEVVNFPAVAREVYDVSGAGDTVIATLAVMLGNGVALAEAVRIANLAGGIVVGKLGTATVTREELAL
ncbi:D-glycero-beta-D-manno-heptose-7-phosphate kinase [Herbaspirillum hiltneri]|uniref:D-glycero-beta-D-manno-heptose-7-phosphate kinase n=1 Tax=Herbaspirillum hiltneri TaxID=341045 RepID=UPI0009FB55CC|nr:D-glycero-beta-D-manno-heptose-7-phosphate kinase [Herbaspirillum hiltneri]